MRSPGLLCQGSIRHLKNMEILGPGAPGGNGPRYLKCSGPDRNESVSKSLRVAQPQRQGRSRVCSQLFQDTRKGSALSVRTALRYIHGVRSRRTTLIRVSAASWGALALEVRWKLANRRRGRRRCHRATRKREGGCRHLRRAIIEFTSSSTRALADPSTVRIPFKIR